MSKYSMKRVYAIFNEKGEVIATAATKSEGERAQRSVEDRERFNADEAQPKECPDKSGRIAPSGQHWVRNAMNGLQVLEACGTLWSCSVASEGYWSA
jgi:hypothetical protein